MNKQQLEDSRLLWIAEFIGMLILSILIFCFFEYEIVPQSYHQGFQDGQTNCTNQSNEIPNVKNIIGYSNMYPELRILNAQQEPILKIMNTEPIFTISPNGTIWAKQGQEKEIGEQLAKISIAYSSYKDGWCNK